MSCAFGPAVVAAFVFAIGNGNKDNVIFNRDLLTNRSPTSDSLSFLHFLASNILILKSWVSLVGEASFGMDS